MNKSDKGASPFDFFGRKKFAAASRGNFGIC